MCDDDNHDDDGDGGGGGGGGGGNYDNYYDDKDNYDIGKEDDKKSIMIVYNSQYEHRGKRGKNDDIGEKDKKN